MLFDNKKAKITFFIQYFDFKPTSGSVTDLFGYGATACTFMPFQLPNFLKK